MKWIAVTSAAVMLLATPAFAADFTDTKAIPGAITGTMTIDFGTRVGAEANGTPAAETIDTYLVDIGVTETIALKGKIVRRPWLPTAALGSTRQEGFFAYDLKCVLRKAGDPSQTRTLGQLVGAMRLDGNGRYFLAESPEGRGRLRIATESIGKITGFVSNYAGEIQGRPAEQAGLWGMATRATKKVQKTYVRYAGGKVVKQTVSGADPMGFDRVELAQGPLSGYPASKLNGSIDYDAEQGIWYVDVKTNYMVDGNAVNDRYSGTIRWNEDANRSTNGIGWYDVNVRINEKPVSEEDAFSAPGSTAEDEFFAADNTVPGFTGRINYVDTFAGDTVTASKVSYAVDGASVSKVQTMNFAKMLLLMVGPFNDE